MASSWRVQSAFIRATLRGLKGLLHLRLIQSDALVDLAAQAPACGEVHKDRAALAEVNG